MNTHERLQPERQVSDATRNEHFFHRMLDVTSPLLLWAVHFFGAYAFVAAACTTSWANAEWMSYPAISVVLLIWTALALLAVTGLLFRATLFVRTPGYRLQCGARFGCAVLGVIGIAWTAVPLFFISVCGE